MTLQEIQKLEDERLAVMIAGDTTALGSLLSDELLYGHSSGALDTKSSLLDSLSRRVVKYKSIRSKVDHVVRLSDNMIVASGWLETSAEVLGKPKSIAGRYLALWRLDAAGPRLAALQGSAV